MSALHELILPAIPDRDQASAEAPALLAAAREGGIALEAHAVERLSSLWAQLIAMAAGEARKAGTPFLIRQPSAGFLATFRDLGLDLESLGPILE